SRSTGLSARFWTGNFESSQQAREVFGIHGLDQVRGEPGLLRALPIFGLAVAGECDHHRWPPPKRLHPACDLVAVEPGQTDVDQRDLGCLAPREVEPFVAIGTGMNLVAIQLEQGAQGFAGVGVVLDEEDAGHCLHTIMRAKGARALTLQKLAADIYQCSYAPAGGCS